MPVAHLTINCELLRAWSAPDRLDFVRSCARLLGQDPVCTLAFIDSARSDETAGGRYYCDHGYAAEPAAWHRLVERVDWAKRADRWNEIVRGPYWGMYFPPALRRRLDPSGDFGARFKAIFPPPALNQQTVTTYDDGAMLLTCGDDPRRVTYNDVFSLSHDVYAAAWLKNELRQKDML